MSFFETINGYNFVRNRAERADATWHNMIRPLVMYLHFPAEQDLLMSALVLSSEINLVLFLFCSRSASRVRALRLKTRRGTVGWNTARCLVLKNLLMCEHHLCHIIWRLHREYACNLHALFITYDLETSCRLATRQTDSVMEKNRKKNTLLEVQNRLFGCRVSWLARSWSADISIRSIEPGADWGQSGRGWML